MTLKEFDQFKEIKDDTNPFAHVYELDDGCRFYIEPVFYTQLKGFEDHYPERINEIINAMIDRVKKNKYVVFVGTFDYPQTEVDDSYIFLEITDITDPLKIFVEDKSRGSDYGD